MPYKAPPTPEVVKPTKAEIIKVGPPSVAKPDPGPKKEQLKPETAKDKADTAKEEKAEIQFSKQQK
jgi:hypothetical protein